MARGDVADAGGTQPMSPTVAVFLVQQRIGGKRGRLGKRRTGGQQRRRDQRHGNDVGQMLGLQPRPRPEVQAVANAERHVGTAKLDDAAVVVEHQVDLGKRRPEPVEPGHQPGAGEGRLDRYLQAVGRRLPAHLAQPPVDRVEAGGELTQQRAAGIGQPHTPMQALEQRRSEQRLELADLPADGCLRHQQLFGRAAEAQVSPGGFEAAQCRERQSASLHSDNLKSSQIENMLV